MKFKRIHTLLLLFLVANAALAQVTFKASVNKFRVGLNERLKIDFTIDKQGADNFTPPSFKNFTVLAGPSQSSNFSMINGRTSYSLTYSYIIQPTKKGNLTIASASVEYNGAIIKSNTLKVAVTNAVAIPKDVNDPRYIASQNIHLVAQISKTHPFVGQSIVVVYKLYVNVNKVSVRNTRETQSPAFNGFWNQNIDVKNLVVQQGSYQGQPHKYVIVKKSVLIPQKSGKLIIDPMEIEITAGVPIRRRDLFGNMMYNNVTYVVTTGKKTIDVKPLPLEGKPTNFNGAVGDYNFKVLADKTSLKLNETAQIKVEIQGHGNLKLIDLPKLSAPNGLEVYEPEHKEKISTTQRGMQGKIYDQYTIVPQFKGKYKIPILSFSFFNPADKTYHVLNSPDILIEASYGKNPGNMVITSAKQNIKYSGSGIRYIHTKTKFNSTIKPVLFGTSQFYLWLLIPFIFIPIAIVVGKKQKERANDVLGNKRRKADKLARKYLSKAKKEMGNKEAFYIALEKALHNYLKATLRVETSEISKDKIASLLQERKVNQEHIDTFITVLTDSDFARYTPSTNVKIEEDYNRAKRIIAQLDKQL
ncbi:MAG: BatD family protein [Flavobacteriaceae bacterium]|nr:BatD family protein [Flavobacteriaceae bacterium]